MGLQALYPSIPRQKAQEVIQSVLNQRQKIDLDANSILKMMDAVLENIIFSFSNKQYIQAGGTVYGSKLGRSYAYVYMRKWECILFEQCYKQPFFLCQMYR